MNTKSKYILSLVTVLMIGIILGFLLSGLVIHTRINRLQDYYTEQGFRHQFMRTLQPTPKQMEQMRPILMNYGQKNRGNMMEFRSRQRELMLELKHELKPYLSPAQNHRLLNLQSRWNHRFMDRRDPGAPWRGRGPGRPGRY